MLKKGLIAAAAVVFFAGSLASYTKGSQYEIAEKYADPGQAPLVIFDPEEGKAIGYIIYANLDGMPGDEIIIPYSRRVPEREMENKGSFYPQEISIDVISGKKKIRDFIKVPLDYVRTPKPYIAVKKMFLNETPKVFLMVYDGFGKTRGPDRKYVLLYNGLHKADKKREKKQFETARMPWRFILYRFNRTVPTVTEFHSKLKHSAGFFYIYTLEKGAGWPKIPVKKIKEFGEKVRKYQPHIYWEYGNY